MFYLVVPVIDLTAYEFDKLLSLPFSDQHPSPILYYFDPKTPYLLIAKDHTRYSLPPIMQPCHQLYTNYQICRFHRNETIKNSPCIVNIFLQDSSCQSTQLTPIKATASIWEPIGQNEWLFSVSTLQNVHFLYENFTQTILLPYTSVFQVPSDCRLQVATSTFWGCRQFESSHIHQIPTVNLTIPHIKITKLTELHAPILDKINLEVFRDLHAQLEQEQDQLETAFGTTQQHHVNWMLSFVQFLILCVCVYFLYCFVIRRYCCHSNANPTQKQQFLSISIVTVKLSTLEI